MLVYSPNTHFAILGQTLANTSCSKESKLHLSDNFFIDLFVLPLHSAESVRPASPGIHVSMPHCYVVFMKRQYLTYRCIVSLQCLTFLSNLSRNDFNYFNYTSGLVLFNFMNTFLFDTVWNLSYITSYISPAHKCSFYHNRSLAVDLELTFFKVCLVVLQIKRWIV